VLASSSTSTQSTLLRFFRAARGAGVRISPAESLDAVGAVAAVGYADRGLLRDALLLTLAKTEDDKRSLAECFDLFFSRADIVGADPATDADLAPQSADLGELAQMLRDGDQAALSAAMAVAADAAGLSDIRYFTQRGIFARRILDAMGQARLDRDIAARAGTSTGRGLAEARDALRDGVRDLVAQAILLYAREETESLRDEVLRSTPLSRLDRRDVARMRTIVAAMARRLRDRYSKPRKARDRGRLDARRTIRRNAGWGGVPFLTVWRRRRIEKPRIMALCDVSGSVARTAEFLLLFLYSLNEAISDIRTFAFSAELVEVSDVLEAQEIEPAIRDIMARVGLGSSNYGRALEDFDKGFMSAVTNRTTVIILGDGRTNYLDPRTDILRRIAERARRVIWLNPESRYSWGIGDSEMPRYAPYCRIVRPCGTVEQLERVVSDLLAMDRR
jgi:uncharacterized protein with von Willebrand factor type A (vWA) domain